MRDQYKILAEKYQQIKESICPICGRDVCKCLEEMMEPVDDKSPSGDSVAEGMASKLRNIDKSDEDAIMRAIGEYELELKKEWKDYHHGPMPQDVRDDLYLSMYKGMVEVGIDPSEYFN